MTGAEILVIPTFGSDPLRAPSTHPETGPSPQWTASAAKAGTRRSLPATFRQPRSSSRTLPAGGSVPAHLRRGVLPPPPGGDHRAPGRGGPDPGVGSRRSRSRHPRGPKTAPTGLLRNLASPTGSEPRGKGSSRIPQPGLPRPAGPLKTLPRSGASPERLWISASRVSREGIEMTWAATLARHRARPDRGLSGHRLSERLEQLHPLPLRAVPRPRSDFRPADLYPESVLRYLNRCSECGFRIHERIACCMRCELERTGRAG